MALPGPSHPDPGLGGKKNKNLADMLAKTSNFSREEVLRLISLHEESTVREQELVVRETFADSQRLPGEDGPQEVP